MSLFDEKLPYGWNLKNLEGCLLKRPDVPQVGRDGLGSHRVTREG